MNNDRSCHVIVIEISLSPSSYYKTYVYVRYIYTIKAASTNHAYLCQQYIVTYKSKFVSLIIWNKLNSNG